MSGPMSENPPHDRGDIPTMDCLVIGGCANGLILKDIFFDAQKIELARPDHIKPLANASQAMPEVVKDKDIYEIHPIALQEGTAKHRQTLFGFAVLEGQTIQWAFSKLVTGYVQNVTNDLIAAGLVQTPERKQ